MSETKHTPKLPVTFDGDFIADAGGRTICQFFNKWEENFQNREEYAALIVEAVNSHALLREAEEALQEFADWGREFDNPRPSQAEIERQFQLFAKCRTVLSRIRAAREAQENSK